MRLNAVYVIFFENIVRVAVRIHKNNVTFVNFVSFSLGLRRVITHATKLDRLVENYLLDLTSKVLIELLRLGIDMEKRVTRISHIQSSDFIF
jgi:hypothetical protein